MTAPGNLNGIQFQRPERVSREEHTNAVRDAQQRDPGKYWAVSPPEPRTQSFAVRDQHGNTHGYFALGNARRSGGRATRYLGGLINTSGVPDLGSFVLRREKRRNVNLDAFSGPLEGFYTQKHGLTTTNRTPFDSSMAPPSWKPEYGSSDVVDMTWRRPR